MQFVHGHFQASPGERGEGLREMEQSQGKEHHLWVKAPISIPSSDHLPVLHRGTTLGFCPHLLWRLFSLGSYYIHSEAEKIITDHSQLRE